jgi:vacuolar protein-sorting-associated protein 4
MKLVWNAVRTQYYSVQVKDVLFEPVRKTQDAMHFRCITNNEGEEVWMPCGPRQRGAVQTTMEELASRGLAAKVSLHLIRSQQHNSV